MNDSTLLVLTGMGIPPYSARGLNQQLVPIRAAGQLHRTVNGDLIDLSETQFQKYSSQITCEDMDAPALDGIWQGQILTVDCVCELSFETSSGGPQRTVVAGSEREANGFTFYRPRLTMRVTNFRQRCNEWGALVGWELALEEI